jgi:translocation and assembly module TamB
MAARGGWTRALGRVAAIAALVVVGVALTLLAVLDTPWVRRLAVSEANHALANALQGRIELESLGELSPFGIGRADVTVFDPQGKEVLKAQSIRVRLATWTALRSLLFDHGPIDVVIPELSVERLDVRLDEDARGQLGIANAFGPKSAPTAPSTKPGRGVRLTLSRIAVARVVARGNVTGSEPLDAGIDAFVGAVIYAPDALEASITNAAVAARRLGGAIDVSGSLQGHVLDRFAAGVLPDATLSWHGVAGNIANALSVTVQGEILQAVLDAPAVPPQDVRALWAASPFVKPGRLHVEAHGPKSNIAVMLRAAVDDATIAADGAIAVGDGVRGHVTLVAEVPGGRAQVSARLSPEGSRRVAHFALEARVADLGRIPELPLPVQGSASAAVRGSMDLGAMVVDADVAGDVVDLTQGDNRVGRATLDARVRGPVGAPEVDALLQARALAFGGRRIDWVDVGVRGSPGGGRLTMRAQGPDIPSLDASTDVQVGAGITLKRTRVVLTRGSDRATVSVPMVTLRGDSVRVSDARIEGVGGPAMVTVETEGNGMTVRAVSEGLDLGALARIGGMQSTVSGGTLALDVDADLRRDGARGRVAIRLDRGAFGTVREVSGAAAIALDGRTVTGRLHVDSGDVGKLDVDAPKLVLPPGGPLSSTAWRRAWGDITVDGRADLAKIAEIVPADRFPFAQAGGMVAIKAHVARSDADAITPDVDFAVTTKALHLVPKVAAVRDIDGVLVVQSPPWRLEGMDFDVSTRVSGRSGRVDLSMTARDAKGPFARVEGDCPNWPWNDALHAPQRLSSDLLATAFEVHVTVPRRGLGGLPAMLRQDLVAGTVEADIRATGTAIAPRVDVTATVRDSVFASSANPVPIELRVSGRYDGKRANVTVSGRADGRDVVRSEAQADLDAGALLGARGGTDPWTGSVRAHFDGMPLKAITALDDKMVSGRLSGDVTLSGLHREGRADVELSIDALRVGSVAYKSGRIMLRADGRQLNGELHIDQGDGFVDAKVDAESSWGAALVPTLSPGRPIRAQLASKAFRVAALLPFVDGVFDELDGRLDADARLELDPRARASRLSGTVALTHGTVEAIAGGGEFHDISADVSLSPDGSFELKKLSASGMTGRLEATGSGRLAGTRLLSAKATVTIPRGASIPVSAGGSELGSVDGRVEVSATSAGRNGALQLQVTVPSLRVTLPEGSSGDVQALGLMPDVRIGAHRGNPATFVLLPAPKTEAPASASSGGVTVAARLEDVEVLRGTDLKIDLDGAMNVQPPNVTGQIRVKQGGTLVLQGRTFTVDSGTVSFVGPDPSNPEVVVRAGYTAPDATVIYASFVGPLKTGKVTLTSEPSLPQQEIVELLIFGTTGGPQAQSPSTGPESSVVGAVGGEAAQPLNHALSQMGLGAVRANVDTTTSSTNPRPEVEIQAAKDISFKVAVVLGQVPPGVNPDHTLLTVAWRFLSRWSLASTLGDAGTTIFDLLWQRRY